MRVRVLYFGVLKDVSGCDGEVLELAEGASVADLLRVFRGSDVGSARIWDSIAVAVNQSYARGLDVLKEGDEVALLPPVSGGFDGREGDYNSNRSSTADPCGDDDKKSNGNGWESVYIPTHRKKARWMGHPIGCDGFSRNTQRR